MECITRHACSFLAPHQRDLRLRLQLEPKRAKKSSPPERLGLFSRAGLNFFKAYFFIKPKCDRWIPPEAG